MNFGENLKKLRKEKQLSQESLAEKLNISRQAVSKWESNSSYPDMNNLIQLKDIFNVTLDEMILIDKKDCEETLKNNPNNKDDISKSSTYEKEEMYESLIIGGFIIGIAVGFVTENFSFGLGGSFIGMGIGYILEYTKVQGILKKFQK
ncbi:MAG: helix-turn-helix domain-containing protein [Terrisporobacter sp.]|uniref:helix-turn-helix domain-containing protein n=1 Tax=Terrisporobacter sp. TaxID=1965305 RepID=UPI0039937301